MYSSASVRRNGRRSRPLLLERLESRVNPGFVAPLAFDAGIGATSVAVGEFNGDGIPDLAVANIGSTASVFLGNGDGSFQPPRTFSAGTGPTSVAVGDCNGDARQDLAVANQATGPGCVGPASRLLCHAARTVLAPQNRPTGRRSWSVAVGEFNGDSRPDLAVANREGNTVSVLLGSGDGSFQAAQNFPAGIYLGSVA